MGDHPVVETVVQKNTTDVVLGIIRGPGNTILLCRKSPDYTQWVLPGGPMRVEGGPKKNLIGIIEKRMGLLIQGPCITFAEYFEKLDYMIHVYNVEIPDWSSLPQKTLVNMKPFEKSFIMRTKILLFEHHKIFEEVEKQYQERKLSHQHRR